MEALTPTYTSAEAQAVIWQVTLLALPVLIPHPPYASLAQEAGSSAQVTDKTPLSGHGPSILSEYEVVQAAQSGEGQEQQ